MNKQHKPSDDLSEKIVTGVRKAAQKLVEQRAANNETLVIMVDGKPCNIPAKDLLKRNNNTAA